MGQVNLLHYRPWRGEFREPWAAVWPIARVGLRMMFRYWPFWVIYGLGLMVFLLFFFGQYLLAWAETQTAETDVRVGGFGRADPRDLVRVLRHILKLNGTGETYRNFFWYQGYIVMVVLALAGALLVGNDIRHGSMPFYLSKPITRWHYLLGKCLAVGVFINMMTTLPALLLFVQYRLLDPLLVDGLSFGPRWRLIDLWNDAYLVGNWCLGINRESIRPYPQPEFS